MSLRIWNTSEYQKVNTTVIFVQISICCTRPSIVFYNPTMHDYVLTNSCQYIWYLDPYLDISSPRYPGWYFITRWGLPRLLAHQARPFLTPWMVLLLRRLSLWSDKQLTLITCLPDESSDPPLGRGTGQSKKILQELRELKIIRLFLNLEGDKPTGQFGSGAATVSRWNTFSGANQTNASFLQIS